MSSRTNKILRKYALLHNPDGSSLYAYKEGGDKKGATVRYSGYRQFLRALKRGVKSGEISLDEIEKELKEAGALDA